MGMSEGAYLTSKEVANRWRLSDQTLANWRHAGKGPPFIRVGSRVRYPMEGINAWENSVPALANPNNIQTQTST